MIPIESAYERPALDFFRLMLDKLDDNNHKRNWRNMSEKWLLHRAHQELGELQRAIEQGKPFVEVAKEAADVANFCMMVADVYGENNQEA